MINFETYSRFFELKEVELTDSDFFLRPEVNEIGAALLPVVNVLSTQLTTFEYSSSDFQLGQNFYPGELGCNKWDPHCKWHLQTGIALVDFEQVADTMKYDTIEIPEEVL